MQTKFVINWEISKHMFYFEVHDVKNKDYIISNVKFIIVSQIFAINLVISELKKFRFQK